MFRFANEIYLYFLLLIPILIALFIFSLHLKKRQLKKFGDLNIISVLMQEYSRTRPIFKFILMIICLSLIILAISRPQFGSKIKKVKRKGIELVIALDVSNSMLAEDIKPNRLERAKMAISKLIERLEDDKIALIVFAGEAYIQLPITTDYTAAKLFLSSIDTRMIPAQGTAIGSAIQLAINSFTPETDVNKALIIISDGENHEDDAVVAAQKASEKGIKVYTIGMGLPQGAPIPIKAQFGQINFKKDQLGRVVVSKLNEDMLKQIAMAGNGAYTRANNINVGLDNIFNEINKLEKKEFEAKIYSDYDDKFQYLIAPALIFLLLEFITLERKNKLLKNINIFKIKL